MPTRWSTSGPTARTTSSTSRSRSIRFRFPTWCSATSSLPTQVIAGSTFNVSYTVTNLGSGPTLVDDWTDSVWLTRDKTRPIPASGDILLTRISTFRGTGARRRV